MPVQKVPNAVVQKLQRSLSMYSTTSSQENLKALIGLLTEALKATQSAMGNELIKGTVHQRRIANAKNLLTGAATNLLASLEHGAPDLPALKKTR